jgi:uncharacterized membrane protein YeaQ/YmgE (transglycosylase-associated protein family)
VLIIAIILLGMLAGFVARWIVGRTTSSRFSNAEAFAAGIGGSFVGGLLASLVSGDGLAIRASGIIGSTVGAIIVLLVWAALRRRTATTGS